MKKILVTGGAGFIGSHLCKRLAADPKNRVYCLDNYFTGSTNNHVDGVQYIEGETKNITELIDFKPEIIYHLGEYSRVEQSFDDIELVLEYNKKGTLAVLEFVRIKKCKLIYAGSSTKFMSNESGLTSSPYSWSKATNTELVKNYGDWFGIKYAITYFYNVYGPKEIEIGKYATLIALFKNKMKEGLPLTVVLPGNQKRNFTHISDIVDGLVIIGEYGYGDEFGIGSKKSYSVNEVANLFGGKIKYLTERKGNRLDSKLITKKTSELGWKPKFELKDYIEILKKNHWREK